MYSSTIALRRNLLSRTQHLKPLTVFWRSQKTEANPLDSQETSYASANPKVEVHDARPFEEIPTPNLKFNLETLLGVYQSYKMTEGFTKLYKITNMMFWLLGAIYRDAVTFGIPSGVVHIIDPDDFEKVFRAEGKYPRRPPIDAWLEYRKRRNHYVANFVS